MTEVSGKADPRRRPRRLVGMDLPPLRDARWGQIAALSTFNVLGQIWLHFAISLTQLFVTLGLAVGLELVASHRRDGGWKFPASGLITGLGLCMLLRSADLAPFVVAPLVAIGSKYLIAPGGRHIFNPSNFGLVFALAFTGGVATVSPGQWGTSGFVVVLATSIGVFLGFRVRRLLIVAAFFAAHGLAAVVAHAVVPHVGMTTMPVFGTAIVVFAFYMMSDPRTSPSTTRGAVIYATSVAALGEAFSALGSGVGVFVALAVVCMFVPLVDRLAGRGGQTPAPFTWDRLRPLPGASS